MLANIQTIKKVNKIGHNSHSFTKVYIKESAYFPSGENIPLPKTTFMETKEKTPGGLFLCYFLPYSS